MIKTTLIYKSSKGKMYRIIDDHAPVTRNEWRHVVTFQEWLLDLAAKEDISSVEVLLCADEQILADPDGRDHGRKQS